MKPRDVPSKWVKLLPWAYHERRTPGRRTAQAAVLDAEVEHPPVLETDDTGERGYVRADLAPTFRDAVLVYNRTWGADDADWLNAGVVSMRRSPKPGAPEWYDECPDAEAEVRYWKLVA